LKCLWETAHLSSMSDVDDFEIWLGRIGGSGRSADLFTNRVRRAVNLAGGMRRARGGRASGFTGARIGRGSSIGTVLASRRRSDPLARRVIVKASIVRLGQKGLARASAHMRYLQRDGTTRSGERGHLYSANEDRAEGRALIERGAGDRHQFRFIVSPEDGSEYEDLKPLVRRLMDQAAEDLGTRLDWVAVDHFNTGHPHAHVIVRGKDDKGKDLVIARDYITHGFRERATELVKLDLGPRTEHEIALSARHEIDQKRFTGIDRELIATADQDNIVTIHARDPVRQDLRIARLRRLEQMGLAEDLKAGNWRLDPDLEPTLRKIGMRGDIIRQMNAELRDLVPERSLADQVVYEPDHGQGARLVGRVVSSGLSDEHADRHYVILDGIDGRSHYVDIGHAELDVGNGAIVEVMPRLAEAREVDRTVARIAAANGGRYTPDLHLAYDRAAQYEYAKAHERRLEAIRRATGGVSREPNGTWNIAPDHVERAAAYERRLSDRNPVEIETLSHRPLEKLAGTDGATWLDRELISQAPENLGRGFGAEVQSAMQQRLRWLLAEGLAESQGEEILLRANLVATLQQRQLRRVAATLSRETGLDFKEARTGAHIEGVFRRAVQVGDRKFAVIERSRDFTLVPWRPTIERERGNQIGGIMRDDSFSWRRSRDRGLEIS